MPIDPDRVRAPSDPYPLIGVQALVFARPAYLQILIVLLVLLIAVAAIFAVAVRDLGDLVFGIGSRVRRW